MRKIAIVDRDRCVACGACAQVCRRGAVTVHAGCYARIDGKTCAGCGLCARACPAGCIKRGVADEKQTLV